MHKLIYISWSVFFPFAAQQLNKYDSLYADEYRSALNYTASHTTEIKKISDTYKNNPQLLSSIVFPELMRYSLLQDVLETGVLELTYIDKGPQAADFSIGRFQMKPSFAEDLERQLQANDSLGKMYNNLLTFKSNDVKAIRTERIKRLGSFKWQLIYLNSFVSIINQKFPDKEFASQADKVSFYAAAYNGGYHKSSKEIETSATLRYYPYGTKYKGKQYSYSDVAVYYFNKTFAPKISNK